MTIKKELLMIICYMYNIYIHIYYYNSIRFIPKVLNIIHKHEHGFISLPFWYTYIDR